jgi:hypothetical protein
MAKTNSRLEAARTAYREALDSARAHPTPEAWARLLAAGKDLSAASEPRVKAGGRRSRRQVEAPPLDERALEGTQEIEALD